MVNKVLHLAVLAFVVMLFIWGFKQLGQKYDIPVVSKVSEEV